MKNYLIILFIACSTFVSAQSLELFYSGATAPDTITITSNVYSKNYLEIANVSSNDINMKWESETSVIQGATISFCAFETCITLTNGYKSGTYPMEANDTINGSGFYVEYDPNGNIGTTYLKFTFSDEANPLDNVSVVFKFVSESVGICNPSRQTVQTFETYPNPAKSAVYVQYGLNDKSIEDIQLVLHSLTGSVIKTIAINSSENTVRVDVEDLAQGIYFCSLKVDGVISSSKKIVVTK